MAAATRVFYGLFYLRIDAVFLDLAVQGIDQVIHRAGRHVVARLMGGGADMRQRDDVRQAQQRRIFSQRLVLEDIKAGSVNLPACRAAISACSSTTGPRPALIKMAEDFILANCA